MAAGEGEEAVEYLTAGECPYQPVLKQVLRAWLAPGEAGGAGGGLNGNLGVAPLFQDNASGQTDEDRADLVLDEVQRTIDAMRNIEQSLDADDTDSKMNLLKSKTGLLEKWVQIKERSYSIKQVAEFQRLVVSVLDDMLDKDKVQDFKKRLAEIGDPA